DRWSGRRSRGDSRSEHEIGFAVSYSGRSVGDGSTWSRPASRTGWSPGADDERDRSRADGRRRFSEGSRAFSGADDSGGHAAERTSARWSMGSVKGRSGQRGDASRRLGCPADDAWYPKPAGPGWDDEPRRFGGRWEDWGAEEGGGPPGPALRV